MEYGKQDPYLIPEDSTWIEIVWFAQLCSRDKMNNSYINSGNLIIHKSLFNKIGGFNAVYETGENERFCKDAVTYGGVIFKRDSIAAIHHGYPKTIKHFFNKERWHGLAMKNYLLTPWKYRDLTLALYYVCLIIMFCLVLIVSGELFLSFITTVSCLAVPLFLFAVMRSGREKKTALVIVSATKKKSYKNML